MQTLTFLFPLVLTNNLVMSLVKWVAGRVSNTWLRVALAVLSMGTVVVASALTGNPVDFNQLSSLGTALVEALAIGVGAHFSFKAITA